MQLVNVLFITYNHSKFVAQALDSVLGQKTNFDFKIIIGDDCSNDGTREIVNEYAKNNPDKIVLSNPQKNLGPSKNYIQLFDKCASSKYMAYLEGDDYWTDNLKLQKQVDFMENNPDYTICFHNVDLLSVNEKGENVFEPYNKFTKDYFTFNDLIYGNPVATGSCLFRNSVFTSEVFKSIEPYDDVFHLLYLENGKAKFLDEKMGVYRMHSGSTWSSKSLIKKYNSNIKIRKMILDFFHAQPKHKSNTLFYLPLAELYKNFSMIYFEQKNLIGFLKTHLSYLYFAKKGQQLTSYRDFFKLIRKLIASK